MKNERDKFLRHRDQSLVFFSSLPSQHQIETKEKEEEDEQRHFQTLETRETRRELRYSRRLSPRHQDNRRQKRERHRKRVTQRSHLLSFNSKMKQKHQRLVDERNKILLSRIMSCLYEIASNKIWKGSQFLIFGRIFLFFSN